MAHADLVLGELGLAFDAAPALRNHDGLEAPRRRTRDMSMVRMQVQRSDRLSCLARLGQHVKIVIGPVRRRAGKIELPFA